MSGIQSALLEWFSKASNQKSLKLQDIKTKALYQVVAELPKMPSIQFTEDNENSLAWQTNYINYKSIYQAIQIYYRSVLKSPLPVGLPSVNLLEISKGHDKEGLLALLTIFFIACINSDAKEKYIRYIMDLEEAQQMELMNLIQEKSLTAFESSQQDTVNQVQEIQRNKIDELYFKIQSLASQNQSLTIQLMAEGEQKNKLKEQIKKLQQQNRKVKRELDEKSLYIQQKQQQEQQEQSTNKVITDSNQEVIRELKRQIVEQQRKHLDTKMQMKQQIETLKEQLIVAKDKIAELQSQDIIGMTSNRRVHHQDCVSINEHKNITQKLQMKLKTLQQKQTQLERQVLRAKYEHDELLRKCKKEQKQKQNLKVQYEKISSNKPMMTMKDADKMKISILGGLRDKLKQKLGQMEKKQTNSSQKKVQATS